MSSSFRSLRFWALLLSLGAPARSQNQQESALLGGDDLYLPASAALGSANARQVSCISVLGQYASPPPCIALPMMMMIRPTQSNFYVPLQVDRFQKSILLIVQYTYLKSCSGDFILQNLILRTKSCGNGFITEHSWLLHFHLTEICRAEMFCATVVPALKGHLGGASP